MEEGDGAGGGSRGMAGGQDEVETWERRGQQVARPGKRVSGGNRLDVTGKGRGGAAEEELGTTTNNNKKKK